MNRRRDGGVGRHYVLGVLDVDAEERVFPAAHAWRERLLADEEVPRAAVEASRSAMESRFVTEGS